MRVPCHLQAARLNVRHSINFVAAEEPRRQGGWRKSRISRRCSKEENLLPCSKDTLGEQLGKHLPKPRPAGKHELSGGKGPATRSRDAAKPSSPGRRHHLADPKFHSALSCLFHRRLHSPPCQQHAAPWFQQPAVHSVEIHL